MSIFQLLRQSKYSIGTSVLRVSISVEIYNKMAYTRCSNKKKLFGSHKFFCLPSMNNYMFIMLLLDV